VASHERARHGSHSRAASFRRRELAAPLRVHLDRRRIGERVNGPRIRLCVALARRARGEASERYRGHERVELTAHAQPASQTCRSTLCGKAAKRARGSFRGGASSQPGTSATSLVADPLRAGSKIGVLDAQNLRQGA
jgi:hypothetical protein